MTMKERIMEKIREVMTGEINPALAAHGGIAEAVDFQDGKLVVRLGGQCVGCPSADYSTKFFIEETMQKLIPEVKEVVLDDSIDPDLLQQAREILFGKRASA